MPEQSQRGVRLKRILRSIAIGVGAVSLCVAVCVAILVGVGRARLRSRTGGVPQIADGVTLVQAENDALLYDGTLYTPRENLFTLLAIGLGSSEQRESEGYTLGLGVADTLLLVVMDLDTGELDLLCIPRDTMTEIALCGTDGTPYLTMQEHLALQYAYGGITAEQCAQNTVDTVRSTLLDVPVDAWLVLDMDVLVALSDALGGIPMVIPDDPYYCAYTGYTPGQWVMLDGEAALQFVQYRDTFVFASCEMRIERQKVFLNVLLDSLKKVVRQYPYQLFSLYNTVATRMEMDLTVPELAALAAAGLKVSLDDVQMTTLPGEVQMGLVYEEFYLDDTALRQVLLQTFYRPAA